MNKRSRGFFLSGRIYSRHFVVFSFSILVLLSACSILPENANIDQTAWPPPPAKARIVYDLTLRNQRSLNPMLKEDRMRAFATGGAERAERVLLKPYDVAAYAGLVAVSDSLLSVVHIFDVPRKKLYQIGWRGDGKLSKPLGLAVDQAQNVYVADAGLGQVVKFDKRGHYLGSVGRKSDFSRVSDVAVDEVAGLIYILDRGGVDSIQHRIVVYSMSGERLRVIGTRGHGDGEFNHPNQLAVDHAGQLFVLDAGNFRVQIFDRFGAFVRSWGRIGMQLGNLARPRGIALGPHGNVYITDAAYQNFQVFNQAGQLLINVGSGGGSDKPGYYILPAGIAVDETGRIYVVDQVRRKIEVFRLLGAE